MPEGETQGWQGSFQCNLSWELVTEPSLVLTSSSVELAVGGVLPAALVLHAAWGSEDSGGSERRTAREGGSPLLTRLRPESRAQQSQGADFLVNCPATYVLCVFRQLASCLWARSSLPCTGGRLDPSRQRAESRADRKERENGCHIGASSSGDSVLTALPRDPWGGDSAISAELGNLRVPRAGEEP